MIPPAVQVTLSYGPATPQQAASWRRLWDLIWAGVEHQSANALNEGEEKPETARPLRKPPKRLDTDESIRPRSQGTKPRGRNPHR